MPVRGGAAGSGAVGAALTAAGAPPGAGVAPTGAAGTLGVELGAEGVAGDVISGGGGGAGAPLGGLEEGAPQAVPTRNTSSGREGPIFIPQANPSGCTGQVRSKSARFREGEGAAGEVARAGRDR